MIEYVIVLTVIGIIAFLDFSVLNLDEQSETILYSKVQEKCDNICDGERKDSDLEETKDGEEAVENNVEVSLDTSTESVFENFEFTNNGFDMPNQSYQMEQEFDESLIDDMISKIHDMGDDL